MENPAFLEFDEQFLLYVDASSTGIGFALAQVQDGREVVITFNGRGLNQAECNYKTIERESLALVEGIVAKLHFVTSVVGHACSICIQLSIVYSYFCG